MIETFYQSFIHQDTVSSVFFTKRVGPIGGRSRTDKNITKSHYTENVSKNLKNKSIIVKGKWLLTVSIFWKRIQGLYNIFVTKINHLESSNIHYNGTSSLIYVLQTFHFSPLAYFFLHCYHDFQWILKYFLCCTLWQMFMANGNKLGFQSVRK